MQNLFSHSLMFSALLAVCACSVTGCTHTPKEISPAPHPMPEGQVTATPERPKAVMPEQLGLDLARINYALSSLDKMKTRWPWLATDQSCIALTALDAQYLLQCAPPEGSPYRKSEHEFRGAPIYINDSGMGVLGPQKAPYKVFAGSLVGTVMLYHPKNEALTSFAKGNPWLFVTSLDALIEAHPAFDETTKVEEWLAIFVHEFFHSRQFLQKSAHDTWGKIISGSINPENLNQLYRSNEAYKKAIDEEFQMLKSAVEAKPTPKQAREVLKQWLQKRNNRLTAFSSDYKGTSLEEDDTAYLYIEGVARYVESLYSVDAIYHQGESLKDPRFSGFEGSLGAGYAGMKHKTIPQGKYYYALGLHIGLLLDVIDPTWTQRVHEQPQWLIDEVQKAVEEPTR